MFAVLTASSDRVLARDLARLAPCEVAAAPLTEQVGLPFRLPERDFDWIFFTSARTLYFLGEDGRAFVRNSSARIASVGPATTRALHREGLTADLEPANHSAAGLVASLMLLSHPGQSAWLPGSAKAKPTLATGLSNLGLTPTRTAVYDTVPVGELPTEYGCADVVAITSASAASALAELMVPAPPVVNIGAPSRKGALDVGLTVLDSATEPTAEGLAQSLERVSKKFH